MTDIGRVVVLNGAPRAGKSSIVEAVQETAGERPWVNLGVDRLSAALPARFRPGIGLRPGAGRPDLETFVAPLFAALYDAVAAHARHGLDVIVDVGHHDGYVRPLGTLADAARRLDGLPAWLVGVRCPIDVVAARRAESPEGGYVSWDPDGAVAAPVRQWEEAVHRPGLYDLEVDTSVSSPAVCAEAILRHLAEGPSPWAFEQLRRDAARAGATGAGPRSETSSADD